MKPRFLALLLGALLVGQGAFAAQQATLPAAAPVKPAEVRHPLLWKVSDADNSVYLLGSFHMLKPADLPLPAEVGRALEDSSSLLFEVDPAALTSPDTAAVAQRYMGYADGKTTLSSVIPKQTAERLGTLLSAGGSSLQAVEQYEPWAVSTMLSLGLMQALGFRQDLGVDRWLAERAAEAGKPARGLETAADGFAALDAIPYPEQVRELDEFLDDPQKVVNRLRVMHDDWRTGDVAGLEHLMQTEMVDKSPDTFRLVVVQRNRNWLPQVERRLTDEHGANTLVVVGALHLLGPEGLVEQLRAKGYKVERVCDACAVADIH